MTGEWKDEHSDYLDQWESTHYIISEWREWVPIDDFAIFAEFVAKDNEWNIFALDFDSNFISNDIDINIFCE